jgi:hypothetical protein
MCYIFGMPGFGPFGLPLWGLPRIGEASVTTRGRGFFLLQRVEFFTLITGRDEARRPCQVVWQFKSHEGVDMAKRRYARWTKKDHRELRAHSKARTPVVKISKKMKRTARALRQQAFKVGIPLGHQR